MDAKLLKAIATRKGVSMTALAKAMGISRNALYLLMSGKSEWSLSRIHSCKSALDLSDEQIRDIFF